MALELRSIVQPIRQVVDQSHEMRGGIEALCVIPAAGRDEWTIIWVRPVEDLARLVSNMWLEIRREDAGTDVVELRPDRLNRLSGKKLVAP